MGMNDGRGPGTHEMEPCKHSSLTRGYKCAVALDRIFGTVRGTLLHGQIVV